MSNVTNLKKQWLVKLGILSKLTKSLPLKCVLRDSICAELCPVIDITC